MCDQVIGFVSTQVALVCVATPFRAESAIALVTGFEPGSSVPEADAMSTAPCRRKGLQTFCGLGFILNGSKFSTDVLNFQPRYKTRDKPTSTYLNRYR
jgi:hypothetical protein